MTALAPTPDRATTGNSGLDHIYCCDPGLALCGTDVSDVPEIDPDSDITCVVCADLEDHPCSPGRPG
ncbi:hypothetical protein [Streptomyces sp. NBC_01789]|uniref:hypothetical protein n=1 Tax=Streptomyces sp. NBC_01789 TaxID=2975941 RepID=UPI00224FFA10|nr:hypothetical protein [Streptomyces sp. NBC_01789]MCX4450643.1 hypothetical protein [Streptomyces sp. NBC_01789]